VGFEPGSYDPEADAMSTAPHCQGIELIKNAFLIYNYVFNI
jgi:hypothetical protein